MASMGNLTESPRSCNKWTHSLCMRKCGKHVASGHSSCDDSMSKIVEISTKEELGGEKSFKYCRNKTGELNATKKKHPQKPQKMQRGKKVM